MSALHSFFFSDEASTEKDRLMPNDFLYSVRGCGLYRPALGCRPSLTVSEILLPALN